MPKRLVIVESPAKATTIHKILGNDYVVKATRGHVRDLPRKKLGVDIEQGFEPEYEVIEGKSKVLSELRAAAKASDDILLAADPDREGEAICWHVAHELRSTKKPIHRIEFQEITADAVRRAVADARDINQQLVDAQQARRVLDRLVGYQISPMLWRHVGKGLSAGRVQSVAVRLICDRENEIRAFRPEEYWTITATLADREDVTFDTKLFRIGDEKPEFGTYGFGIDSSRAESIADNARQQSFVVKEVTQKQRKQSPAPPFTTSTLQQEASRKLSMTVARTMGVAQTLYQGVDIGSDVTGLITYMRTDSTRVAEEALSVARAFIREAYGKELVPSQTRRFASRKGAQDAHEAIRPTDPRRTPDSLRGHLGDAEYKLYDLIWKRFIASQMADAIMDTSTIDIAAGPYTFRATGSVLRFAGFRTVYLETDEDTANDSDDRQPLPDVKAGDKLSLLDLLPRQHFTEPPPRYTEASLVKALEVQGIGRPSTYAAIISTIQDRNYVRKERGRFFPTDTGEVVTRMLIASFPNILDVQFTANMESELDAVEEGKRDWIELMREFYGPFTTALDGAPDRMYAVRKQMETVTQETCDQCGRPMARKWGRFGFFLGCSGYPDCANTAQLPGTGPSPSQPVDTGVKCPDCGGGTLLQRTSRRGKVFFGCSTYPKCNFAAWDPPLAGVPCPECGAPFLTVRRTKTRQYNLCYRKECGYKSEPTPPTDEPLVPGMEPASPSMTEQSDLD
ncbi:type I DNA topoisomerase [Candidatus Poribacteria bacterium]|nr:type I DNA topoisomerase [Candidatus Poribacteria bacterium]